VTTVVLDTHVIHWLTSDSNRLSRAATRAIEGADELAAADVSWWELAWLADHGRIDVDTPIATWLTKLAAQIRTIPIDPAIALTAARLPASFPSDPIDRLIFATAIETGSHLVTKDEKLRAHPGTPSIAVW
jgi:PIN domain nuclease of toxin-antitoxin system